MKTALSTLTLIACVAVSLAQDKPLVFSDKSGAGQLWANISLTYLRLEEDFLPMVVGVQNFSDERAILTRDSFWLVVPDGRQYPLAELKDVRKNYDKSGLDRRVVSAAGIPVDLWASNRRLRESNFFPDIRMTRRPTVVDKVTLRRNDGMADLMYFITPEGFEPGMPFLLVVLPQGWETPLRLRLVVGE